MFDHLQSSKETVEGRPYSPKYQQVESGDTIVFTNSGKKHKATVKSVKKYKTLKGYLRGEGLRRTLPDVTSVAEATQITTSGAHQSNGLSSDRSMGMLCLPLMFKWIR